jgi:hypothetical protein
MQFVAYNAAYKFAIRSGLNKLTPTKFKHPRLNNVTPIGTFFKLIFYKNYVMKSAKNINMQVDGVPYFVKAIPCEYNAETQYQVSVNGSDETLFAFDSELGRYRAAGNAAVSVPDNVEAVIGDRLNGLSLNS